MQNEESLLLAFAQFMINFAPGYTARYLVDTFRESPEYTALPKIENESSVIKNDCPKWLTKEIRMRIKECWWDFDVSGGTTHAVAFRMIMKAALEARYLITIDHAYDLVQKYCLT